MLDSSPKKAFISVIGTDRVGIIGTVSTALSDCNINIEDISQTILQGMFSMLMAVDFSKANRPYEEVENLLNKVAADLGVEITVRREEIFKAMHRI